MSGLLVVSFGGRSSVFPQPGTFLPCQCVISTFLKTSIPGEDLRTNECRVIPCRVSVCSSPLVHQRSGGNKCCCSAEGPMTHSADLGCVPEGTHSACLLVEKSRSYLGCRAKVGKPWRPQHLGLVVWPDWATAWLQPHLILLCLVLPL